MGLRERNPEYYAGDEATLQRMGHKQELERQFSTVSMLGLAFAILNTWTALSASLNVALPSGGPSTVIWGLLVAGCCNLCLAASLAEFLSAYPTAGGQYHWAAIVCPKRWSRGVSYATGWINVSGWVALSATGGLLASTFILNIITLMHPTWEPPRWVEFLLFVAVTLIGLLVNIFLTRILPHITQAGLIWSVTGFVVISIVVVACATPDYQPASFVYGGFQNNVQWPDGFAWMLGLLQGAFSLTGFDATVHMVEEMPQPHIRGPKIMLLCIGIGMLTGFAFLSCLMFVMKDVDTVINSPQGPLMQIFMDATGSRAGSICLFMFPVICMVFTTISLICTSARMSYAFARDRGMPFSSVFAKVHPKLEVPLNALLWTAAWDLIFGFLILGSSSSFNAITGASVVALGVTYAIPPAIHVLRGRKALPSNRAFKIPEPFGWICNIVGILWALLTTVLFVFPPERPVTATNMNYCIVAFGVMLLVAGGTWIFNGRKHYAGPYIEIEGISSEQVHGLNPVQSQLKPSDQMVE